jgi:hypothetical protein
MLQRVQAEVREPGYIFSVCVHAEDPACFLGPVGALGEMLHGAVLRCHQAWNLWISAGVTRVG